MSTGWRQGPSYTLMKLVSHKKPNYFREIGPNVECLSVLCLQSILQMPLMTQTEKGVF